MASRDAVLKKPKDTKGTLKRKNDQGIIMNNALHFLMRI